METKAHRNGSGASTPGSVPQVADKETRNRRPARRLFLLAGALVAVLGLDAIVNAPYLRAWWLERLSLSTLREQADAPNSDAATRLTYARRLFRAGSSEAALAALKRAEAALPPAARDATAQNVHALQGYLLARDGNVRDAVPRLERARALNDNDPLVYLGLGRVLEKEGKFDSADAQYRVAVELDKHNAEGWYGLGHSANAGRKPQQAIEPLTKAIALRPDEPTYHAELGHAYAYQRQFASALDSFRHALALAPNNADYQLYAGMALSECARTTAEYQEAVTLLNRCAQSDPHDANLHYALGTLHLRFNALNDARTHLAQCVQLGQSNADGWYNMAQVEKRLNHAGAAQQAIQRFNALKEAQNTQQVLEKRVQVLTGDPNVRLALARHYAKENNLVGAAQQYQYALQIAAQNTGNANGPVFPREAALHEYQFLSQRMKQIMAEHHVPLSQLGALGPPLTDPPSSTTDANRSRP